MEATDQKQFNLEPHIIDLPPEVIKEIADLGGNKSNLRTASKFFFDVIRRRNHFNLGLIKPIEMEKLVQIFGRYKTPIGLTFNKPEMLSAKDMAHLTSLTQLTSLYVKPVYLDGSIFIHLTNLVSLEVDAITASASYISSLTKLRRLNFTNTSGEWPDMKNNIVTSLTVMSEKELAPALWFDQFNHLQSLHMGLSGRNTLQKYHLSANVCKNLTSLSLNRIVIENKDCVPWHQLRALSMDLPAKEIDKSTLYSIATSTNLTSLKIKTLTNQQVVNQLDLKECKQLKMFELTTTTSATPFWQKEDAFIEEISKMTNLEECRIYIQPNCDMAAFMTMTQLTSLVLSAANKCYGLENMTNLTNLKSLDISTGDDFLRVSGTISFSKMTKLESLSLSNVAMEVDIRGITRLEKLKLVNTSRATNEIAFLYNIDDLKNLKEITLSSVSTKIPWNDLAQCSYLQNISIDSFDTDNSALALQHLKYLTRIGQLQHFISNCTHYTAHQLAHLTRLQIIDITVPTLNVTKQTLEEKLPMLLFFKERPCGCSFFSPMPSTSPRMVMPPFFGMPPK